MLWVRPLKTLAMLTPVLAEQVVKVIFSLGGRLGGGARSDLLPTIMISAV